MTTRTTSMQQLKTLLDQLIPNHPDQDKLIQKLTHPTNPDSPEALEAAARTFLESDAGKAMQTLQTVFENCAHHYQAVRDAYPDQEKIKSAAALFILYQTSSPISQNPIFGDLFNLNSHPNTDVLNRVSQALSDMEQSNTKEMVVKAITEKYLLTKLLHDTTFAYCDINTKKNEQIQNEQDNYNTDLLLNSETFSIPPLDSKAYTTDIKERLLIAVRSIENNQKTTNQSGFDTNHARNILQECMSTWQQQLQRLCNNIDATAFNIEPYYVNHCITEVASEIAATYPNTPSSLAILTHTLSLSDYIVPSPELSEQQRKDVAAQMMQNMDHIVQEQLAAHGLTLEEQGQAKGWGKTSKRNPGNGGIGGTL